MEAAGLPYIFLRRWWAAFWAEAFIAGYSRRIDAAMLGEVLAKSDPTAQVFICGPTPLVEGAAEGLVALGLAPARIRTERFGPTGN